MPENNPKMQTRRHIKHSLFHTVTIHERETTPSWRVYGNGWRALEMQVCDHDPAKPHSGWVHVELTECAEAESKGGRDITRVLFMDLDMKSARELRDLLLSAELG